MEAELKTFKINLNKELKDLKGEQQDLKNYFTIDDDKKEYNRINILDRIQINLEAIGEIIGKLNLITEEENRRANLIKEEEDNLTNLLC